MTAAPEQPRTAVAGNAPVAAPAAGYVGTLIAVLLLGLGAVALRDGAVSAGWLNGHEWTKNVIGWLDGLAFAWWMIPAGIVAIVIGLWWVYAAVRPRRRTAVAVDARSSIWMSPADLARVATAAAESVAGVLDARSSATLHRITVTAHTTADGGTTTVKSAIADAVREATAILGTPTKIRVKTRTGDV